MELKHKFKEGTFGLTDRMITSTSLFNLITRMESKWTSSLCGPRSPTSKFERSRANSPSTWSFSASWSTFLKCQSSINKIVAFLSKNGSWDSSSYISRKAPSKWSKYSWWPISTSSKPVTISAPSHSAMEPWSDGLFTGMLFSTPLATTATKYRTHHFSTRWCLSSYFWATW